jgi:hypothetical protein
MIPYIDTDDDDDVIVKRENKKEERPNPHEPIDRPNKENAAPGVRTDLKRPSDMRERRRAARRRRTSAGTPAVAPWSGHTQRSKSPGRQCSRSSRSEWLGQRRKKGEWSVARDVTLSRADRFCFKLFSWGGRRKLSLLFLLGLEECKLPLPAVPRLSSPIVFPT